MCTLHPHQGDLLKVSLTLFCLKEWGWLKIRACPVSPVLHVHGHTLSFGLHQMMMMGRISGFLFEGWFCLSLVFLSSTARKAGKLLVFSSPIFVWLFLCEIQRSQSPLFPVTLFLSASVLTVKMLCIKQTHPAPLKVKEKEKREKRVVYQTPNT